MITGLVVGDDKASQSELDRAKTEAERTAAVLRSARYWMAMYRQELRAAQAVLRYSAADENLIATEQVPITTPVSGQILEIHHESEGIVTVFVTNDIAPCSTHEGSVTLTLMMMHASNDEANK